MTAKGSLGLIGVSLLAMAAVACGSSEGGEAMPLTAEPSSSPAVTAPTLSPTPVPTATERPVTPTVTPLPTGTVKVPPATPTFVFIDNSDCAAITRQRLPLADVRISDGERWTAFAAELAVTPAEQAQGLMCRSSAGNGMVFAWDFERTGGFWMFNTYVPLDIIFLGASDGAAAFVQMEPCPREDGESDADWRARCSAEAAAYQPGIAYTTALELEQGLLESFGYDTSDPAGIKITVTPRE